MSIFSRFANRTSDESPQAPIVRDAMKGAEWIAAALNSSGYHADFSLESLREVDRFFDEHTVDGRAREGGLLAHKLGSRLFALGAYLGEVIRRSGGGQWQSSDEGAEAEIELALVLPNGDIIHPVQRVMKRFRQGREDGVYGYAAVILRPA